MTSPSEPVESREQPRGIRSQTSTPAKSPWPEAESSAPILYRYTPSGNVGQGTPDEVIAGLRSLLAERDATIRDLRAEVEDKRTKPMGWHLRAIEFRAERDAALAEVSRLREQGEAIRAVCAEPCRGMGCTGNDDGHIDPDDILSILEAK